MDNNTLQHHGIKGQRWGIRRYQNSDGSLTPLGEKRYGAQLEKFRAKEEAIKRKQALRSKKNEVAELKRRAKYDEAEEKAKRLQDKLDLKNKKQEIADMKKQLSGKNKNDNDSTANAQAKPQDQTNSSLTKKSVKDMSDAELRAAVDRLNNEKRFRELTPEKVSFGRKIISDVIGPAATSAGKTVITDLITKSGKKMLGLDDKSDKYETPDSLKMLKDQVQELNLKRTLEGLKKDE